jgi:ankyrin repeat protein
MYSTSWEANRALVTAVQKEDTKEIRRLVEEEKIPVTPAEDIDRSDYEYESAIASVRPSDKGPAIAKYLINHGANINDTANEGQTLLHVWSMSGWRPESIPILVGYGANVNTKDRFGNTPLHSAVIGSTVPGAEGDLSIPFLLAEGADPNIKNKDGQTPIDLAKSSNAQYALKAFEESREGLVKGLESKGARPPLAERILRMAKQGGRRKTKRNFAKRSNGRTRQRRLRKR